jgi:hypothetical protein
MMSVPHQLERVSVTNTAMTKKIESMTVLPMARLRSPLGASDITEILIRREERCSACNRRHDEAPT